MNIGEKMTAMGWPVAIGMMRQIEVLRYKFNDHWLCPDAPNSGSDIRTETRKCSLNHIMPENGRNYHKVQRSVAEEKRFEARHEWNDHNVHIITRNKKWGTYLWQKTLETQPPNNITAATSEVASYVQPKCSNEVKWHAWIRSLHSYSKQSAKDTVTASPMKKGI